MQQCVFNQSGLCRLLNTKVKYDNCRCPYYATDIAVCSVCGSTFLDGVIDESGRTFCKNCNSKFGTCAMCEKATECLFESDPSPIPKIIRQTTQQNGMYIQQDIRNPDRIRQTCQNGCSCFNEDLGCLKQNGTCGNYKEK